MALTKQAQAARERYRAKVEKMDAQVQKLQEEIQEGERRLAGLAEKHREHLNAFKVDEAEQMREEIAKQEDLQQARRSQLDYLQDPAHPLRQQAKADYLAELKDEKRRLVDEYAGIHEELLEARQAYAEKVAAVGHYAEDLYTVAATIHNEEGRTNVMPVPVGIPSFNAYEVYSTHFANARRMAEKA